MGVDEAFVEYPYMLSQDNGDEYNTNTWWYAKIIRWLSEVISKRRQQPRHPKRKNTLLG
jgi:hypothetical protein